MSDKPDVNDMARAGTLPADPSAQTERSKPPLRSVLAGEKRRPEHPADTAAESAMLGAFLWAGQNAPDRLRVQVVADILEDGQAFYGRGNGDIFDAMKRCAAASKEHDPVAVHAELLAVGLETAGGGLDKLRELLHAAGTIQERQVRAYAQQIREMWARREVLRTARELVEDARNPKMTSDVLIERARTAIKAAGEKSVTASASVSLRYSLESFYTKLSTGKNTARTTGLSKLDEALNGGLRPGEVSVIAARTSVGKSVLGAQISEHVVTSDPSCGVLYVTLEMSHEMFSARLLAARAGVPLKAIRKMELTPRQWTEVTATVQKLADKGLYFADNPSQTLAAIYAAAAQRARVLAAEQKRLAMVVIDYLGLVKPSAEALKRGTREQQVAETSRGQRFIAAELGCHVMGLAQIGREAEKTADRMPRLHQLRESGSIEQDADLVLILHRERDVKSGLIRKDKPPALALAKGKMDEPTIMLLGFDASRATFTDAEDDRTYAEVYGD